MTLAMKSCKQVEGIEREERWRGVCVCFVSVVVYLYLTPAVNAVYSIQKEREKEREKERKVECLVGSCLG